MELQWPLILFTTLVAWSAGVFGTQSILALKDEGRAAQMTSWIVAAVLLVAGGIAVFFHLQHFERIFNGFGHLTSGITQELIAIVVLAVVAVVYLALMRKGEGKVPAWIAIVGIICSAALVIIMAHSYMMAARPAWDNVLWVCYVLGNACVLGPATVALICALKRDSAKLAGLCTLVGSVINAAATVAYAVSLQMTAGSYPSLGYYFNPTTPEAPLADAAASANVFTGEFAPLMWVGVIIIGAAIPLVAAFLARRGTAQPDTGNASAAASKVLVWMAVAVIAAVIGAICMRVVFYGLGASVFMYY